MFGCPACTRERARAANGGPRTTLEGGDLGSGIQAGERQAPQWRTAEVVHDGDFVPELGHAPPLGVQVVLGDGFAGQPGAGGLVDAQGHHLRSVQFGAAYGWARAHARECKIRVKSLPRLPRQANASGNRLAAPGIFPAGRASPAMLHAPRTGPFPGASREGDTAGLARQSAGGQTAMAETKRPAELPPRTRAPRKWKGRTLSGPSLIWSTPLRGRHQRAAWSGIGKKGLRNYRRVAAESKPAPCFRAPSDRQKFRGKNPGRLTSRHLLPRCRRSPSLHGMGSVGGHKRPCQTIRHSARGIWQGKKHAELLHIIALKQNR